MDTASDKTAKTVIAEDIEVIGTIKCASNIQFDGKLEGDIHCSGYAVIGKTASIKGNTSVDSITIMGTINGNVVAKDRIEMKSTARVHGDIKAKRLTVEDGVTFIGRSEVNPSGTPIATPSETTKSTTHATAPTTPPTQSAPRK